MKNPQNENNQNNSSKPWRRDAAPINRPPTDPGYPEKSFNHDEWMNSSKPMKEGDDAPTAGDVIRTKKLEGKVTKVEDGYVYFTTPDGRNMRNTIQNATVIEKLVDQDEEIFEDEELNEISSEVLAKYKTSAGKAASEADKKGDFETGNKRFKGIVQATKKQFAKDVKNKDVEEGSMGGINRSAPATDVSYEKVLDEVTQEWAASQKLDELSVDTLKAYKRAATNPSNVRTMPLRDLEKHRKGAIQADDRIAVKTGDRTNPARRQGPNRGAFGESLLANLFSIDEANDPNSFTSILNKQQQELPVTKKRTVDIPFHGWTIRYRPSTSPGEKVSWMVLDKKFNEKHRGSSMSDKDAVSDAEEWIKSGGGTKQESTKNVTIDFNVNFTDQFGMSGNKPYVTFGSDGSTPYIIISSEPIAGAKKTHVRNQKDKITATTTPMLGAGLSAKESNALGLQPNGRYILGDKDPIDDTSAKFPLIFQGVAQSSTDRARMGKPGFIVAHSREVDEDCWKGYTQYGMKDKGGKQVPNCVPKTDEAYEGPWAGDPKKQAKAPKTTTRGSGDIRLTSLVQDSIKTHGVKWAFDYYVKKHGMPPKEFQIFAGLTPKLKDVPRVKDEWTDPSRTNRPEKKGWWAKLRGKLPFEE